LIKTERVVENPCALAKNLARLSKTERVGLCTDRVTKNPTALDSAPTASQKNRPRWTPHRPRRKKNDRVDLRTERIGKNSSAMEKNRPRRAPYQYLLTLPGKIFSAAVIFETKLDFPGNSHKGTKAKILGALVPWW